MHGNDWISLVQFFVPASFHARCRFEKEKLFADPIGIGHDSFALHFCEGRLSAFAQGAMVFY
jgi:hypothetical protein